MRRANRTGSRERNTPRNARMRSKLRKVPIRIACETLRSTGIKAEAHVLGFYEKNHRWVVLFCFIRALWRDGMEKAPQAMLEGLWYVRFTQEKDYSSTFT